MISATTPRIGAALLVATGAVALGFAWRARGGADWMVTDHTTLYRMAWALPYAVIVSGFAMWRGVRLNPLLLLLFAWLMLLNGHGVHMDMGAGASNWNDELERNGEMFTFWLPGSGAATDFVGMAVIGAVRGLILAVAFANARAFLLLPLAGPVSALGYLAGWHGAGDVLGVLSPNLSFPTAVGEFTTGFAYGLLSLIVVWRSS